MARFQTQHLFRCGSDLSGYLSVALITTVAYFSLCRLHFSFQPSSPWGILLLIACGVNLVEHCCGGTGIQLIGLFDCSSRYWI